METLQEGVFLPVQVGEEELRLGSSVFAFAQGYQEGSDQRGAVIGREFRGLFEKVDHGAVGLAEVFEKRLPGSPLGGSGAERLVNGRERRPPSGKQMAKLFGSSNLGLGDVVDDICRMPLAGLRRESYVSRVDRGSRLFQVGCGCPDPLADSRGAQFGGAIFEVFEHVERFGSQRGSVYGGSRCHG